MSPFPTTWYYLCQAADVGRRPRPVRLFDKRLVLFRTANGRYGLVAARCAHFGADLAAATVCGEALRCPFHGWEFGVDGACTRIPDGDGARHRLESLPVEERHGALFAFNGVEPRFPLPFFPDEDPATFAAGRPVVFDIAAPWYMVAANGFDLAHYERVHDRRLRAEFRFEALSPDCCRVQAELENVGRRGHDRILRALFGPDIRCTTHIFAGSILYFEVTYGRQRSCYAVFVQPTGRDRMRVHIFPYLARPRAKLAGALAGASLRPRLAVRRAMIAAFYRDEARSFAGLKFNPRTMTREDQRIADFLAWLATTQGAPARQRAGATVRGVSLRHLATAPSPTIEDRHL